MPAFAIIHNRGAMLAGAAAAWSLSAALNAQVIRPLLPATGATASFAQSINSTGSVAGYSVDDTGNSIPTLWQPSGIGGAYVRNRCR